VSEDSGARRPFLFASVLFAAAALVSRGVQSLDYDELFTVWVASRPFPELIHQANVDGFTPPLFYLLVKAVALAGLAQEDLRVIPGVFAGLAVYWGLAAASRLFGASVRWLAVLLICGSACLYTFAHELRPYSALLACSFLCLGQLGGPISRRSDQRAMIAAVAATAFSYLGASLVLLWLIECRRRMARSTLAAVFILTLVLCSPGLGKAMGLQAAAKTSSIVWAPTRPALTDMLGLASFPVSPWIEGMVVALLVAILALAHRVGRATELSYLLRSLLVVAASLVTLDAFVRIGFAPRYLALPASVLLLLMVGALSRLGRAGMATALVIGAVNVFAIHRYLVIEPPPREDWRGAMAKLEARLGTDGVLLAFPFHHAAVAAHAYSPGLRVGGGYTSRSGPVFWYQPPATFDGYAFEGLTRLDDVGQVLRGLASTSDLCLLSDEPDSTKTAGVFRAFAELGRSTFVSVGDPRLRVICRSRI
jgi:phage shock protein PspC (stress-responsive transcriptional regulator)